MKQSTVFLAQLQDAATLWVPMTKIILCWKQWLKSRQFLALLIVCRCHFDENFFRRKTIQNMMKKFLAVVSSPFGSAIVRATYYPPGKIRTSGEAVKIRTLPVYRIWWLTRIYHSIYMLCHSYDWRKFMNPLYSTHRVLCDRPYSVLPKLL